jgi:hypothetical protein
MGILYGFPLGGASATWRIFRMLGGLFPRFHLLGSRMNSVIGLDIHRGQVECVGVLCDSCWCESPRGFYSSQQAGGRTQSPALFPSEHILSEGG